MNQRKVIYRLMSLLMVLALLVACGGTAPEPAPESEPEPTEEVAEEVAEEEPEEEPTEEVAEEEPAEEVAEEEPTEEVAEEEPTEEVAEEEPAAEESASTGDATVLSLWYHGGGNEVERELLMNIINDFNAENGEYVVEMQDFPQESYNESIVAGALAGDLPDIIDVDGPVMPNWAWSGYMAPLELSDGALDGFLPGHLARWWRS